MKRLNFHVTGAPMKPAARLHIMKQREYRPACPKAVDPAATTETEAMGQVCSLALFLKALFFRFRLGT